MTTIQIVTVSVPVGVYFVYLVCRFCSLSLDVRMRLALVGDLHLALTVSPIRISVRSLPSLEAPHD